MLDLGMLWYDSDSKRDLSVKVERAAEYFSQKYDQAPNLCLVNPKMLQQNEMKVGEIVVQSNPAILPNHLWIGRGEPVKRAEPSGSR